MMAENALDPDGQAWEWDVKLQFTLTFYHVGSSSCKINLSLRSEMGQYLMRESLIYPYGITDDAAVKLTLAKFVPILINHLKEVSLL